MWHLGYGSLFDNDCSVASAPFVEKSILLLHVCKKTPASTPGSIHSVRNLKVTTLS